MRLWKPGDTFRVDFTTSNQSTGAAADADSTPTFTIYRNGNDDTSTWTDAAVANIATGHYRLSGTVPATYADEDQIVVVVAATISTVATKQIVAEFKLADMDGYSLTDAVKTILAFAVGEASGAGTGTITFRDVTDSRDAIVMSVTGEGNRTSVTITTD